MRRLALSCLLLAACTADPNTDFAELPGMRVDVFVNRELDRDADAKRPSSLEVNVFYDQTAFDALDSSRTCATLDFGGTFNGVELELEEEGHYDDFECHNPRLDGAIALAAEDGGHLELRDHHGNTVVADFPAGGARVAWSASGWTFVPGQQVALDWSSMKDLTELTPSDVSIYFNRGNGNGFEMHADALTSSQLHFTVPKPAPTQGDGSIDVIMGQAGAATDVLAATSCVGATGCTLSAMRGYTHSARIEQ
jgi:hypothetical protein